MRLRLQLLSLLLVLFSVANAQTKLSGKVVNTKNEPVAGVSVKIIGATGGTTTDIEGHYSLNLATGKKYELEFSAIGYQAKNVNEIELTDKQVNELNITLESTSKNLEGVVVKSTTVSARKETTASLIAFQKNTNTVASVISAESIRRSPDKNTGEVLKRIPGASLLEDKYLVVRGLSDRYNQAMLNGIQLSSTEPDRKTFSFDIFPSAMIDNIIVNKAFVPELSGEWAGGLVQVNTKDIPSSPFFNIQLGTGFNSKTIGKDFYTYKGGKLDFMGVDDGARALPVGIPAKYAFNALSDEAKTDWGKKFGNDWGVLKNTATPDLSFQLSGGFNSKIGSKKLGGTLALTYSNSNRNLDFQNNIFTLNRIEKTADSSFAYNNNRYSKNVLVGALANIALQLNGNNKISLKNIINVNATDYVTLRTGTDYEFRSSGAPIMARELGFKANTFYNSQLSGEHNLPSLKSKLKWYGSFTILDQYIPKQRRLQYNQSENGEYLALISETSSQKSGNYFYSTLSDYIYSAGGDWTYNFKWLGNNQNIKAGYLFQVKDRLYNSRPFSITLSSSAGEDLKKLSPEQIFAAENFGVNGFGFEEYAESRFRYMANSILNAGFLQFDNQFTNWLRVVWGARVEDFDQVVGSTKESDPRHVHSRVTDVLPAVNATFKLNSKTNLRLTGSQTVIRPEFREISDFAFYDFELGATVIGNRNLKRTKVTNLDLRYEIYPRSGELFTAGVFYKKFKTPIEQYFNQSGAGSSSSFNFINADEATSYGAEIEFRKKLDFANALKNFTFQTNLAYIKSKVESKLENLDRPMQGQSPYIINASLQYDIEPLGINTTVLFNQIGRRILYVGNDQVPEIWENPRPLLDLQIAKKLIKDKAEIKLNVSNILNRMAYYYHDMNNNKKFDNTAGKNSDAIAVGRNYGTNFSLSFNYKFK